MKAMAKPKDPRIQELKSAIDNAMVVGGFFDRQRASAYGAGVADLLPLLEGLIADGQASEALELIERTLSHMESKWRMLDDSSGGLTEAFHALQTLHLKACQVAQPERKKLARHLFERAMASEYGAFFEAPETYAEVLGVAGMKELGRLIGERFAEAPLALPRSDAWNDGLKQSRITAWAKQYAISTAC